MCEKKSEKAGKLLIRLRHTCAHFLYSILYVKSHFLELSHSFRMTAAGRPLRPHPLPFLLHRQISCYRSSTALQFFCAHCSVKAGVTHIIDNFKSFCASSSCTAISPLNSSRTFMCTVNMSLGNSPGGAGLLYPTSLMEMIKYIGV